MTARLAIAATLGVLCLLAPRLAAAEMLLETPVYNEETKSYFELAKTPGTVVCAGSRSYRWELVNLFAAKRVYKGVPGRLAVVKSKSVNDFLLRTFSPKCHTWIGLRWFCKFNKGLWTDGSVVQTGDYSNWGPRWATDGGTIKNSKRPTCKDFWPVHYWPPNEAWVWNANGWNKGFNYYFVEYPTGQE